MAQIEKTNQIDQYLDQIDKKQDSSFKKKIGLVIALLVFSFASIFAYNQFAGKETLANNGLDANNPIDPNSEAVTITVDKENSVTDDELLAELEAEEAAAAAEAAEALLAEEADNEEKEEEEEEPEEKKVEEKKAEEKKPKQNDNKPVDVKPRNINQPTPGLSSKSFTADQLSNVPSAKTFKPSVKPTAKPAEKPKATESVVDETPKGGDVAEKEAAPVETPKEEAKPVVAEKPASKGITRNPSYPGGEGKMKQFFARKISYPNKAINKKIEGSVKVRIKVDETGKIVDSKVVDGIGGGCDREVLKAISKMKDWEPAMEDGVAVPKFYILSVAFKLPK